MTTTTTPASKTVPAAAAARALQMLLGDKVARASEARAALVSSLQLLTSEIASVATAVSDGAEVGVEHPGLDRLVKAGLVPGDLVSEVARHERDLSLIHI